MKVRWTGESVRFRITPSELEQLTTGEAITATLTAPGVEWRATIRPVPEGATQIGGEGEGRLIVSLGPSDLKELAEPTIEGVYFRQEEDGIRFFIEKDFPCIHPRAVGADEPETETFAAPDGFSDRHKRGGNC